MAGMIDVFYFAIEKPVKVMDFVGIITNIEPDGEHLYITLESAKRRVLCQPNLDRLDFHAAPWAWSAATPLDVLTDAFEQISRYGGEK
jgi:hypothetical protein